MMDPRLQALTDQLDTLLLFLERPAVQQQLIAFVLILLLAWLLPAPLDAILKKSSRQEHDLRSGQVHESLRERVIRWASAIEYLFFPLLALAFSEFAVNQFREWGWPSGLLQQMVPVYWLLLIYRVIGALLITFLNVNTARNYQRRFVTPLFIILAGVSLSAGIGGAFPIFTLEIFQFMETPLTLQSITVAIVLLYLFLALAWIARDVLDRFVMPRTQADAGLANTITVTTYYAIISIGIVFSASSLGFDFTALAIIFGGLSVGIGFGLQELVSNFVAGILLLFEQTLRPGDIIEVGGQRGVVTRLRMRSTVLKTVDNIEVFVPNRILLTSTVSTHTHTDRIVRRTLQVGVSYSCDPTIVRDLLHQIIRSHGHVLKTPEPAVFFTGFGENSLNFEVAVWLGDPARGMATLSDLHFMIFKEFGRNGIEIPFPQRDLHLRTVDAPALLAQLDGGATPQNRKDNGTANQATGSESTGKGAAATTEAEGGATAGSKPAGTLRDRLPG
jgi:potassium-dependent mechanosensitive channel